MTGWNMPPGCSSRDIPGNDTREPSKLVEDVLTLLESYGISQEVNDKIVELLEGWEEAEAEKLLAAQEEQFGYYEHKQEELEP